MNLAQINEFRVSHGLKPLQADPRKAEKAKQLEKNRRARAEENRNRRNSTGKGK